MFLVDFFKIAFGGVWQQFWPFVPYVLPVFLGIGAWKLWRLYIRSYYLSKQNWILLEIRLPREIYRSPAAFEVVANVFYQTYEGTWFARLTKGITRTWFSLELVSIDGEIHFFIWCSSFFKNLIESQIYAQYPDVEIYEVPDYTTALHYDNDQTLTIRGVEYGLAQPDPYPIKTYIDFGLEKAETKEQFKVDPFNQAIEFLGSASPGEQVWIQILVQPPRERFRVKGKWFKKEDWKVEAKAEIEKIVEGAKKRSGARPEGGPVFIQLTPGEQDTIKAIERSIGSVGFDCGIRVIYLARSEIFHFNKFVGAVGVFKPYSSPGLNSFKVVWDSSINFPWQDYHKIRELHKKRTILAAYRRRSWFYPPYKRRPFVLSAPELATIYHFPGGVVTTPTLERIPSKRAQPPAGLPV